MFKRLLTSTGLRVILLLIFCSVITCFSWSGATHDDHCSHIEKSCDDSFEAEDHAGKDLCLALPDHAVSLQYLPAVAALELPARHLSQADSSFIPSVSRAPPA